MVALAFAIALVQPFADDPGQDFSAERPQGKSEFHLGALGRVTFLSGPIVVGSPFGGDLDFDRFFDVGLGARAEVGITWVSSPEWSLGPWISLGWDDFPGRTYTDPFGDTLTPDGMAAFRWLVGFRALQRGSILELDWRVLLGAVTWSDVSATTVLSGVPTAGISFLRGSTEVTLEAALRIGYRADKILISLGATFALEGPPHRGSDVGSAVDPAFAVEIALDFGIEARF